MDDDQQISTTAQLLASLDAILFEIGKMENAVRDASPKVVADSDRRALRLRLKKLFDQGNELMDWLS